MEGGVEESKGNNSDTMEMSVDEDCETGYLKDVDDLNQSTESLKESYSVPLFNLNQSGGLQSSQGFHFSGQTMQNVTSSQAGVFEGVNTDSVTEDKKPVFISSEFDLASLSQIVGKTETPMQNLLMNNANQTVFNTGALVMTVQNNPGFVTFGQTNSTANVFNTDNVFTFGGGQDSSESNTANTNIESESCSKNSHGDNKGSRSKHPVKHRQRKSRSQSTASDNGQKIDPQPSTSPSRMETMESQNNTEIGFKPSLLDEILTEKKIALMRSPEVVQFLQAQQKKITHGQYTES